MNWSAALAALVWPLTVAVTSTVPLPTGLLAAQVVVVLQLTDVPADPPKATVVAPGAALKPVPVIVTTVPPVAGPLLGLIPVIVGAGGGGGAVWSVLTDTSSRSLDPTMSFQSCNRW